MKILWLTIYRGNRVARHFDTLHKAICKEVDVNTITKKLPTMAGPYSHKAISGKTDEIFNQLKLPDKSTNYDFVVCDALFAYLHEDWKNIKIPKIAILEDLHGPVTKHLINFILDNKFDGVFTRYNAPMKAYHPELLMLTKVMWLPHSVDNTFKYYGKKTRDVIFTGATGDYYPIRRKIVKELSGKTYFERFERPPETHKKKSKYPVGEDYAKLISSAKIHPTTGAKVHYPVMKFFEIPACKTLLISDYFDELKVLGFRPGKNMVRLDLNDIDGQMKYWLKNDKEREKIALAGQEFIKKDHTVERRAKDFVYMMENFK
jgi:hypothetical protein